MSREEDIDKYLKGELTEKEQQKFEQEMEADANLGKEVKFHQAITEGIKDVYRVDLINHFGKLEEQIAEKASKGSSRKGNVGSKGLVAMLLLAASIVLFVMLWTNNEIDNEQLFAEYYSTYPNYVVNVERSNPAIQSLYATAFQQYEKGQYSAAIGNFKSILSTDNKDIRVAFYLGVAYLENKQPAKALEQLNRAKVDASHRYTTPSRWYAALAALQLKTFEEAKKDLEILKKGNSTYKKKATKLLQQL